MPGLAGWADAGAIEERPLFERRVRDGGMGPAAGRAAIARRAEILETSIPTEGFGARVFFPLKGIAPSVVCALNLEQLPAGVLG